LAYFVECISKDKTPVNDGESGLRVVRMLEAANASIRKRGELVPL
jgi:predicted dehydrogenase